MLQHHNKTQYANTLSFILITSPVVLDGQPAEDEHLKQHYSPVTVAEVTSWAGCIVNGAGPLKKSKLFCSRQAATSKHLKLMTTDTCLHLFSFCAAWLCLASLLRMSTSSRTTARQQWPRCIAGPAALSSRATTRRCDGSTRQQQQQPSNSSAGTSPTQVRRCMWGPQDEVGPYLCLRQALRAL